MLSKVNNYWRISKNEVAIKYTGINAGVLIMAGNAFWLLVSGCIYHLCTSTTTAISIIESRKFLNDHKVS